MVENILPSPVKGKRLGLWSLVWIVEGKRAKMRKSCLFKNEPSKTSIYRNINSIYKCKLTLQKYVSICFAREGKSTVFYYCTNTTRAVLWCGVSCSLHNRSRLSKEYK